jgi:putative ABC transport system permease protein
MLHTTWNRILHGRGRLVLTVLAVALGVTFLTAALVLSGSARAAMTDSYAQVYAGTDVILRGALAPSADPDGAPGAPLPEDTLQRVLVQPGVADAEPRRSSVAQLLSSDDEGQGAIAMTVPVDPARASIGLRTGRLPGSAGEVAVDAAVAEQQELAVGDRVQVLLPSGVHDARIVGTVGFGRLDGLAGGARVLLDRDTAADLLGGGITELAVEAASDTTADDLAQQLAGDLDQRIEVRTATEAAAQDAAAAARQTAPLTWVVMAVAVIALIIGAFLIANTFRMLVAQRTRELALLRALGANRRQVAGSIRIEAAITGAVGSLVGVLLGLGAGAALVSSSAGLLPGMPPTAPVVTPLALLAGPFVGIGVAVLAGRGAARRALAVSPIDAMRTPTGTDDATSRRRIIGGVAVTVIGLAGIMLGLSGELAAVLGAGVAALIVGLGLLFPLVTGPVLRLVSWPIEHAGVTGSLARQQTLAAPRRTGATAAALAVTLGLIGFLLVFSASLGTASSDVLAARQHAELQLSSSAPQGLQDTMFALAEQADGVPGVAAARVVTYGEFEIVDDSADDPRPRVASAYVVDPAVADRLFDVEERDGALRELAAGELAVREAAAVANGWATGDRVTLRFPDASSQQVVIGALFEGGITTDWIIPPATAEGHLGDASREVFVRLDEGVPTEQVQPELERIADQVPTIDVMSRAELAEAIADENESYLGILTAMFALSLAVGMLGVVNTLTLAIYDRIREIGLLRAVGATRGQVRAIVRWEAVITSIMGAALGTALGLGTAWVAVAAMPATSMTYTIPILHLNAAVLATALLGVAASLLPARRAASIDILRAVASS